MNANTVTYKFEIPTTSEWTSVETEHNKHVVYYNNPGTDEPRTRIEGFIQHEQAVAVAANWALNRTAFVLAGIEVAAL